MKKLLALLMALIFVFSFAACDSKDKDDDKKDDTKATVSDSGNELTPSKPLSATEAAEKAADEFFKKVKTANGEELIALAGESLSDIPLDEKDIAIKLFESITSKFDYKIISSEQVNDTTVNVKINFTTADAEAAVGLFFTEMFTYAMSSGANATEDEIAHKSVELMAKAFGSPDVGTKTAEKTVEVKLVNGTWTIEFNDEIFNIISGDMNGAMENLQSQMQ